jgi:hypothetical protein
MKTVWKNLFLLLLIAFFISIQSCDNEEIAKNAQPLVQIAISTSSIDFGYVEANSSISKQITITNSFSVNRRLEGNITLTSSRFSIVSNIDPFSLAPGESKTITIRFSPSTGGTSSDTLNITHNALNTPSPISIPLSGGSQSPSSSEFSVIPASLDFGTAEIGQSSTQSVTITNPQNSTQTVSGNIAIGGTGFSIISGFGLFSLSPGQSKTVSVQFLPLTTGSSNGSLSISHNATGTLSPIVVTLSGSTQTPTSAIISVTPSSIDFGRIILGQTGEQNITISNSPTSTGTLAGSVSFNFGVIGFSIASGGGSFTLSPGQSRTVTVRFSASSTGTYSGSIRISHNATNTTTPITVTIRGEIYSSIFISVLPMAISFGTVATAQTQDQAITISNAASSTGNLIGSLSISGTGFTLPGGGGSYNLAPGQSKTVIVRFSPLSAFSYTGLVRISHNATGTSSPINVSLSGTGHNAVSISVDPSSLNFGTVKVGQSSDQTFAITNPSASTQTLTGSVYMNIVGTGFTFISGSGSFSLPPGQSRIVMIRFTPSMADYHAGSVLISHNAQNILTPISVSLRGSGGR